MAKYHINPETGDPGVCNARKNCPFGDLEQDHYSSPEAARAAYENTWGEVFKKSSFTFEEAMTMYETKDEQGLLKLLAEPNAFINFPSLLSEMHSDYPEGPVKARLVEIFNEIDDFATATRLEDLQAGIISSQDERLAPTFGTYQNGRIYIGYMNELDGEPWADFTVNIPGAELAEDEVILDANGPDREMFKDAENKKYFTYTGRDIGSGFVKYPVAKLSPEFLALVRENL